MNNAILHGGIEELNTIKELVIELTGYQEKNAELLKEEVRLEKLIAGKEKDLNDETESTLKKRKSELIAAYENQLSALNARNKKIRAKKEKDKSVKMYERISEETAELREKNKELALEIKTKLRAGKTPGICNTTLFYALFMPKSIAEFLLFILSLLLLFFAVPFGIYLLFFAEKFGSRTKAARAAEAGLILVDGKPVRPKDEVEEGQEVVFLQENLKYVSNGGYKLERAIETFSCLTQDKIFVDIGASTGGFTDCLLQNGAKKVYAVDVGTSQLCDSLREDSRVVVRENINARYLTGADFEDEIDGVVADVSFISLRLLFPAIAQILGDNGEAIVLIKPQFECENKHIGKSGIVHTEAHAKIVGKVVEDAIKNSLYPLAIVNAPIRKGKNIEYVLHLKKTTTGSVQLKQIVEKVKELVKRNSEGLLN